MFNLTLWNNWRLCARTKKKKKTGNIHCFLGSLRGYFLLPGLLSSFTRLVSLSPLSDSVTCPMSFVEAGDIVGLIPLLGSRPYFSLYYTLFAVICGVHNWAWEVCLSHHLQCFFISDGSIGFLYSFLYGILIW